MRDELTLFMLQQRFGVVASLLTDGTPHVATVHYAFIPETLEIIIQTDPASRKYQLLAKEGKCPASFTTGFEEVKTITAQFDGLLSTAARDEYKDLYFKKFPEKQEKYNQDVFMVFTPAWWRFTDWTKPEGKTALSSDGTLQVIKK